MACNGVLTPHPSPQQKYPLVLKLFTPPPPYSHQTFYYPLQLEMTASAFFTHGYFQQAHVHISEAITTDSMLS